MYPWIFRHLPGPLFLRIIEAALLVALVVAALFLWVFPWAAETFSFLDRDPGIG